MALGLSIHVKHLGYGSNQVCSNDNPRLTLTLKWHGHICFIMHFNWDNHEKLFLHTP